MTEPRREPKITPVALPSSERPLPPDDAKQRGAARQYQHTITVAQLRSRLRAVEDELYHEERAAYRRKMGYDPNDEADYIVRNLDSEDAI